jgi:phosphohistidine phosphatase
LVDAPLVGAYLNDHVGHVDAVVISPAQRTQQTWQLLAEQLDGTPDERTDPRVYDEWGAQMIDVVRELPATAGTALLVGHEPGVSELVLLLADRANAADRDRIAAKFPTCAVAVLSLDRPWAQVAPGCAVLQDFVVPKDLRT